MATENFSFPLLPLRVSEALNAARTSDLSGSRSPGDNHLALSSPLSRVSRRRNFFTGSGVARTFTMSLISE